MAAESSVCWHQGKYVCHTPVDNNLNTQDHEALIGNL